MEAFSEQLNRLIDEKDIKIKDLIDFLDYDKSTFFKIKRGERLPASEKMVTDIAGFLQLTSTESDQLMEAYRIDKVGAYRYYGYRDIEQFILAIQKGRTTTEPVTTPLVTDNKEEFIPVSGEFNVAQAIGSVICQENVSEITVCQRRPDEVTVLFTGKALSMGKKVRHLFEIDNTAGGKVSADHRLYNMDCLWCISPALLSGRDYEALCYYNSGKKDETTGTYLSNVILAGEYAMQYSADGKHAIVFHNRAACNIFEEMTAQYLAVARPFGRVLNGGDYYTTIRKAMMDSGKTTVYMLSPGYCFSMLLKEGETITQKHLAQWVPHREEQIAQWHYHWANLQQILEDHKARIRFMSPQNALKYMERTGYINEIPNKIITPLSTQEMQDIKTQWEQLTAHYQYKEISPSFLPEDSSVSIVSSPQTTVITVADNEQVTVHQLIIDEVSLTWLIYNYLKDLYDVS